MKRKVIQIAGSTQLVSLPRQWAKAHNIQRGAEIDVKEDGDTIIVSANGQPQMEFAELDISSLDGMVGRVIHALYKRGVDELKITFNNPELASTVQQAISKETVGFEILEQSANSCTIRYVSGGLEEFDSVLRRIFLLLLTMSEQTYEALKTSNYQQLKNVAILEEANNRFTTVCRRHLNKYGGGTTYKHIGPLYYIIEELEKLADQYKYICQHFSNIKDKKTKLDDDVLKAFSRANKMLRVFYEAFYKFDVEKIVYLKKEKNEMIDEAHRLYQKKLTFADYWMLHHALGISDMIFYLVGPYIVLATNTGLSKSASKGEEGKA
ncbi:AbrB/MazE/SpoVT family DNA-binding domain-containing protein [Candidatus Woesearchaeota archaeon]|nr:AbrB/MazE/SpoVT family DNA-binding domain-containing protein [Candidatus Woesearchaeota archaeon]